MERGVSNEDLFSSRNDRFRVFIGGLEQAQKRG